MVATTAHHSPIQANGRRVTAMTDKTIPPDEMNIHTYCLTNYFADYVSNKNVDSQNFLVGYVLGGREIIICG